MSRARRLTAGLAVALAVAGFLKLGFWQVERLHWKEGLLAEIATQKTVDPNAVALDRQVTDPANRWHRGYLTGRWIETKNTKIGPRMENGALGYWIVTPFRTTGGHTVLVNRGWVRQEDAEETQQKKLNKGSATVTGTLRETDAESGAMAGNDIYSWHRLDIKNIAGTQHLKNPAPLALFMETATPPDSSNLRPAPPVAALRNEHKQYAIFWFTAAGLTLALYAAALFKNKKQ